MTVTKRDVRAVADLARLRVEEDEMEEFAAHFRDILAYFDVLSAAAEDGRLPLKDTEPLIFTDTDIPPLREDVVIPSVVGREVLAAAPCTRDGFFVVPRILEEQGQ